MSDRVDELQTKALVMAHRQQKVIDECHTILDSLEHHVETEGKAP